MTDREFGVNLVDEVAESGPNWITGADQGGCFRAFDVDEVNMAYGVALQASMIC